MRTWTNPLVPNGRYVARLTDFCKRALKYEAINAHQQTNRQQLREVTFSDLTPHEENQLYMLDT